MIVCDFCGEDHDLDAMNRICYFDNWIDVCDECKEEDWP